VQSDLVQHSREIDQAFRLLIIGNRSLILHCTKTSRRVLDCQQTTLMPRTRPLYKVVEQIRAFLQIEIDAITQKSTNSFIFLRAPHFGAVPVGEEDAQRRVRAPRVSRAHSYHEIASRE
jgi:hypothetical protein